MQQPIVFFFLLFAHLTGYTQTELWGMTSQGGQYNGGTIFKTDESGNNHAIQHHIRRNEGIGAHLIKLLEAPDGLLYGVAEGGANNKGVLFSYNTATGIYEKLIDFDGVQTGEAPTGGLMYASDGKMYGVTRFGGINNAGVLFQYDYLTNALIKKIDFDSLATGKVPFGLPVQASDGMIYTVTYLGGIGNGGTIVQYDPVADTCVKKHDFSVYTEGINPFGGLMQASDGYLYGVTYSGGANGNGGGALYQYDIATGACIKKVDIGSAINASGPVGTLLQASNGKIYGTTTNYSSNGGVIYEYDPVSVSCVVRSGFVSYANPMASLIQANDGKIYGTALGPGGSTTYGAIFQLDLSSFVLVYKHLFHINILMEPTFDGRFPASIMQASNGKMYGLTQSGGRNNTGSLYEYDPVSEGYELKINLSHTSEPSVLGSLVEAPDGTFYGMDEKGSFGSSSIFQFDPASNTFTRKYDLQSRYNGIGYYGSLLPATDGKLYGLAYNATNAAGSIISYEPATNAFFIRSLTNYPLGKSPMGSFIEYNGKLYGLTSRGGTSDQGVLFEYDAANDIYTKKVDFNGAVNGAVPTGSLLKAKDGMFYGVAYGGANNTGVLFQYNPLTGVYTKRFDFGASINGEWPYKSLVQGADSMLYGMTHRGGVYNRGVLFSYKLSTNTYTKLFDFHGTDGEFPQGSLLFASDGNLYGMTSLGGTNNIGIMFQYNPLTFTFTKKVDFNGINGGNPEYCTLIERGRTIHTLLTNACLSGNTLNIPYGISGIYNPGNIFTAELSDSTGSFASPVVLGSVSSTTPGIINAVVPGSVPAATGYRIRIVSSSPAYTGPDNGMDLSFNVWSAPTVTAHASPAIACAGNPLTLTGSGAGSYVWMNNIVDGVAFNPIATANYTVIGTDSNGCQSTATITVPLAPLPLVAATSTVVCAGFPATITANGTDTYVWNTGASGSNLIINPVNTTTSYTVTGTDITTGCSNTAVGTITANIYPVSLVDTEYTLCLGNSMSIAGGANSYPGSPTTTFSNNTTQGIPDNNPVGITSSILVSGQQGITGANLASVKLNINHTYDEDLDIYLQAPDGTIIELSTDNGSGNNNYINTVFAVSGNPVVSGAAPFTGTYMPEQPFSLLANSQMNGLWKLIVVDDNMYDTGTLQNWSLTFLNSPSYTWSPPAGISSTSSASVTFNPTVTTVYTLTVSQSGGCTNTQNIIITVGDSIPAVAVLSDTVCMGQPATLVANGADSYTWNTGLVSDTLSLNMPLLSTTYTVTGTLALSGCSASATGSVVVNAVPFVQVIASDDTLCAGTALTLTASGADSYVWAGGVQNAVAFIPASTNAYAVTGTDTNNCSNTATLTVVVNSLPLVTADASDSAICAGTGLILTGNGADAYSWSGGVINSVSFIPDSTDTYTVTGTDVNNCSNTATIAVSVKPLPAVTINASDSIVCPGTPVILTASGADTYVWDDGSANTTTIVSPITATSYSVSGTDTSGCVNTSVIVVNTFASNAPLISQVMDTLFSSGALSYQWYLNGLPLSGETSDTLLITQNGTYMVETIDANGCLNQSTVFPVNTVGIMNNTNRIAIKVYPNPNNGSFNIRNLDTKTEYTIYIKDMLGRVVYSESVKNPANEKNIHINTAAGIYWLEIESQGSHSGYKIIIE